MLFRPQCVYRHLVHYNVALWACQGTKQFDMYNVSNIELSAGTRMSKEASSLMSERNCLCVCFRGAPIAYTVALMQRFPSWCWMKGHSCGASLPGTPHRCCTDTLKTNMHEVMLGCLVGHGTRRRAHVQRNPCRVYECVDISARRHHVVYCYIYGPVRFFCVSSYQ